MKTKFSIFFSLFFLLLCVAVQAQQGITAGKSGKFGIDGDLLSDQALSGINGGGATGSHDWFKKPGGTGIGLFDTTGAAAIKNRIIAGENLYFQRSMQFPRYTVQDGDILMDASYTRDQLGIGGSVLDKTSFYYSSNASGSYSKLGDDPSMWITMPTGNDIPSKSDIVDAYVNLRRNGTTVSGSNPSNILLHVGASTLANDGDRYVSFIFLKDKISYDSISGKFSNSGPIATGGHSAWTFNADSSVKQTGDIAISFNFGSGGVQSIQLLIWCSYNDYSKLDPLKFDFAQGQWYGNNAKSGWGWAGISRNSGSQLQVWGATNIANVTAPAWGTNSKSSGAVSNNYAADIYNQYQFAEASIDLTTAGIDFALSSDSKCSPPFTRYLVATRSASGFSAPMMDFIGPYEFLDAPTASATITKPGHLSCKTSTLSLSPKDYIKGAYYSWSTNGGRITSSNGDSSVIAIDRPATYVLTASMANGCNTTVDSIVIGNDNYKPKAKAATTGVPYLGGIASLYGGDPVASNYMTPFGGSQGLTYRWTGPAGFNPTTTQNSSTSILGDYQLVVTETRNGCKDTAYTSVIDSSTMRFVLDIKFADFSINTNKVRKLNSLSWKMADASEVDKFVVEKSTNGTTFQVAGHVFTDNSISAYSFNDRQDYKTSYYRIKAVSKSSAAVYSGVIKVAGTETSDHSMTAYSDGTGSIVLSYTAPTQQNLTVSITNMYGQTVKKMQYNVSAGNNVFRVNDLGYVSAGIYLVQVQSGEEIQSTKIKL